MNRVFTKKLILFVVLAALLAVSSPCFAQETNNNQAPNQTPAAEVFGENDRLPFMQQQEENRAAAEPSSGGLILKTLGAMLFVVGLIFFGAWGAKKLGLGGMKADASASEDLQLTIISSVNLGNGRTISTVRFGERVLVVGSTPQSFTLLAEEASGEKISFENSRSVAELLAEEEASYFSSAASHSFAFENSDNSFAFEFERAQTELNSRTEEEGEQI